MKKINVIGAGFAGLTLALKLAQKGFIVEIFEKSDRIGGLLGTEVTKYGPAEFSASALLRTEHVEQLFQELELEPQYPLGSAKARFVFRDKPQRWPLTFFESLELLPFIFKFLFFKKSLQPKPQETLQSWGEKNISEQATRFLLDPAMRGIYAQSSSILSSQLVLGSVFTKRKKNKYHGLMTCKNGMQDVILALQQKLAKFPVTIHLNSEIDLARLQGPVVIATSAFSAAKLLETKATNLSRQLLKIDFVSLISVTLFFKSMQKRYRGFGCLIPRELGIKPLGVLMNSFIFANRGSNYNETWILNGDTEITNTDLVQMLLKQRVQILGDDNSLLDYQIHRWPKALPSYNLELENILANLDLSECSQKIYLHGNYLHGIGLSKILERSQTLSEEILLHHG